MAPAYASHLSHLFLRPMLPSLLQKQVGIFEEEPYRRELHVFIDLDGADIALVDFHVSFACRNEEKTEDDEAQSKSANCCRNFWLSGKSNSPKPWPQFELA